MSVASKYQRGMDSLSSHMGNGLKYFALVVCLLLIFEVLSRRVFSRPTDWNFFVTKQIFGTYFILMAPYGLLNNVNIRIDVLYDRFSERVKAWLDLIGMLVIFLPLCAIVVIYGSEYAWGAVKVRECTPSTLQLPTYHMKCFFVLSFFLLFWQGISEIIKKVWFIRSGAGGES